MAAPVFKRVQIGRSCRRRRHTDDTINRRNGVKCIRRVHTPAVEYGRNLGAPNMLNITFTRLLINFRAVNIKASNLKTTPNKGADERKANISKPTTLICA